MKEKIIVNQNTRNKIIDNLSKLINIDIINNILEDDYYNCEKNNIISNISSLFDEKYYYILSNLCLGYTFEEMKKEFPNTITNERINEFKRILDKNDLDSINVVSLYKYDSELYNKLTKNNKDKVINDLYVDFKDEMIKSRMDYKSIRLVFDYLLSLNYSKPIYKNYLSLKDYLSKEIYLEKNYYKIRKYVNKLDYINNYISINNNIIKPLKMNINKSIIAYTLVNKNAVKELNDIKIINVNACSLFSSISKNSNEETKIKIFIPKGSEGICLSPLNEFEDNNKIFIKDYDLFLLGYDESKEYINALLLSKNKKKYYYSKDEIIEKYNDLFDYKSEVNRELSLYNTNSLQSTITINNDLISHSLETSNKVIMNKTFDYNEFDLDSFIISFIRRISIKNYEIMSSNNYNSLIINGINNNNLIINNIKIDYANEIKKIITNISPDLYFKKNIQVYMLKKKKNPLFLLSAKNIAGTANIVILSLIALALATLLILVIIYG